MNVAPPITPWLRPSMLGTCYCVASAIAYAVMGICMRAVSTRCDPVWVNCVQAAVGTIGAAVYLLAMSARGRSLWPHVSVVIGLVLLGAVTQVGGAAYQWAIGKIGLAICNPLQMGVTLAASALLGLLVMREKVSGRGIVAIIVLSIAVVFLSLGADEASAGMAEGEIAADSVHSKDGADSISPSGKEAGTWIALLGVAAAAASGVAFAILTVGIRKVATGATSAAAIVFYINLMGIVVLGPWSYQRMGAQGMLATTASDMVTMLGVGASNLVAFLLLTKGLQLTTVVRANIVVNSLTIALTVIAGIAIFNEPKSFNLVVGMFLTLIGVAIIGFAETDASNESPITTTDAIDKSPAAKDSLEFTLSKSVLTD